jgi:TonB-linked SusC/RagA family outer membrane protein
LPLQIFAQDIPVKGKIVDELGEPLVAATVYEVGYETRATLTDYNGEFTLNLKSVPSEIRVTYIGFKERIIKVSNNKFLDIQLESDSYMLNEVIAIGYGKQKVITSVGSTASISFKELKQSPSASVQNALVGKLPGLFQQQISGQPGADVADIYIRGISTFANVSKSPLVLIDDIETDYSTLSQLDVNEIEDLSILKDASSTAIYGVKGANGVILVTTRRGKEGKAHITYRGEYGLQSPTIHNEVLGSYDALMVLKEMYENQGKNPAAEMPGYLTPEILEHYRLQDQPLLYPDVNWYDEVMRKTAPQTHHNIDVSGGVKDIKYFVNFGYFNQEGILKEFDRAEDFDGNFYLKRYNLRANLDIQATKDLKLSVNVSAILSEKNEHHNTDSRISGGAWDFWRTLASGRLPSYAYPVRNPDGSYSGRPGFAINPVMTVEYSGYRREFKNNVNGNINAEYDLHSITPGLKLKGTMALTNTWGYNRSLTRDEFPDFMYNTVTNTFERVRANVDPMPKLAVNANTTVAPYISPVRKITSQLILSYGRTFGAHTVSALGLILWDTSKVGTSDPSNFRGFSGRATYDFKNRYMMEFVLGYNGSDRFKAKNRYGTFPAIGAGWNISEEPLLKDFFQSIYVDYFKLKGTYGIVGSDAFNSSNRYIYEESYTSNTSANYTYYFGENPFGITSIYPGALGNSDVRWEKERKLDLGVDLRMIRSRLSLGLTYFDNERYDILTTRVTVPIIIGISAPPVNMGRVKNQGAEFEGQWRDNVGKVGYFLKGTLSFARNKVLEIDEAKETFPLQKQKGRPVGQIYGYIWDGYYQTQEEIDALPDSRGTDLKPGDLRYKDISGPDGTPDGRVDSYDIGPIGKPNVPQMTYGFSLGFNYKGFDLSTLFQGTGEGSFINTLITQFGNENGKPRKLHQNAWREDNRNPDFPRLGGSNMATSTFWLRSNAYLRLKNLELGYTVPSSFTNKFNMSTLRFYANGLNLYTWSGLKLYDLDPEALTGNNAYSYYPQMKLFNFGLQITF